MTTCYISFCTSCLQMCKFLFHSESGLMIWNWFPSAHQHDNSCLSNSLVWSIFLLAQYWHSTNFLVHWLGRPIWVTSGGLLNTAGICPPTCRPESVPLVLSSKYSQWFREWEPWHDSRDLTGPIGGGKMWLVWAFSRIWPPETSLS